MNSTELEAGIEHAMAVLPGVRGEQYLTAVGVVVLLWDHIITLPTEIRLMWSRPFTGTKALFLFLRYAVSGSQIVIGYVLLIMRLYALWDHRKRILQALVAGFILTYTASIVLVIYSVVQMLGHTRLEDNFFHMCVIETRPSTWAWFWVSQIAFDVFVVLVSLINAADRPRGLNVKLLTDLRRDGWLFYLALFTLRLMNLVLDFVHNPTFVVLGFFFDWAMVTVVICRLLLRLEYMKLPGHQRHNSLQDIHEMYILTQ
ncbi:hypothetical protein EWM64_g5209 [Hericium alpestre]|uniref:DUF6533 domain-containing protein n=1 Tax=Hericium alpestre TaxID=135208 RepID=A0A4Y9ZXQ6_9AGAM|nr:hypothetical protein EWM64_g5209 [Hericium alpestre]